MGVPVGTAGGAGLVERGPRSSPTRSQCTLARWALSSGPLFWSTGWKGWGSLVWDKWGPPKSRVSLSRGVWRGAGSPPRLCQGCAKGKPHPAVPRGCRALAPIEVGTVPAASWSPVGAAPPKPHLGVRLCPQPRCSSDAPQALFLWSPQINLSLLSWPEWCDLKGSCGPRCPSATPSTLAGSPGSPGMG